MPMLKIVNRTKETLRDGLDGKKYVFQPNEPVIVSEDVARHVFGYGGTRDDRLAAAARLGWFPTSDKEEMALKRLSQFEITDPSAGDALRAGGHEWVKVTNNTKAELVDAWNGRRFTFPPGASVLIQKDIARNLFAYGEHDKTESMTRLGFLRPGGDREKAAAMLAKFEIVEAKPSDYDNVASIQDAGPAIAS